MTDRRWPIPLVFHYTGAKLPSHARYSLLKALRDWPNNVYLIHDRPVRFDLEGLVVSDPSAWYNPKPFRAWADKTEMPLSFREGFWHHAVERFFMLDQWSRTLKHDRFLHCELDVAIFQSVELEKVLETLPPAVYYPRASNSHAGATWLFSSSSTAFSKLVSFLAENSGSAYEMSLLARFLDEFPEDAIAAPSHYTLEKLELGDDSSLNSLQRWGGVIDVHPLGTWLLGDDPRNTRAGPVFNRIYYEGVGSKFVERLRFHYSTGQDILKVQGPTGESWPVFALHVHSKKMRTGYVPILVRMHVMFLSLPFRVPIAFRGFGKWVSRPLIRFADAIYLLCFRKLSSRRRSPDYDS